MIREHRFVIAVSDLERSAAFYRDALGFEIREIGDSGWRFFVHGRCCIMAGECRDAIPAGDLGDHAYFAYLVVDDVDACHARVRDAGGEILKGVHSEPWGMREFAVRSVDGHRIMVGSEL